ncbi:hypothetical protein BFP71_10280 [Roseivirga misakiensis]|uniref:Mucoidy inhibitor MuiA family protein n=2 Tax=Roseivirga misakiensis TaxID=1563681 RepID=A0A1E5SLC2_9BACT|nr:hypothetical protein BFP71_10280 [Roseivirga misakiensis]
MFMAVNLVHGQVEVESKIISAKVFTQGAELKRTAALDLKAGKNEIKLVGLSANLDPKTIQISGKDITILSVRHENDFIETNKPEKVELLSNKKESLLDSIDLANVRLSILNSETEILKKNMKVIGNEGIGNSDYRGAIEYFELKFEKNANLKFVYERKKAEFKDEIELIEKQIKSYNSKEEQPTSNILLTASSNQSGSRKISISYALPNAGWYPSYDIRAVNTSKPLSLTYKARVFQNSGVDWKEVALILSSGNLESSGTAPTLLPFRLGSHNQIYSYGSGQAKGRVISSDDGLPLVHVNVAVKGTTLGTVTDVNGDYDIQLPNGFNTLVFSYLGYVSQEIKVGKDPRINVTLVPDVTSLGEVVTSLGYSTSGVAVSRKEKRQLQESSLSDIEIIDYQTSFVYEIKHPYSIPSTGQTETVEIQTLEVYADYIYSTSPKAKENAYLVAEIPEWEELKLLDGESNLYFEESFVGKSIIDTNIGRDTLDISLGKDEGIVVGRKRLKEFEKNKVFSNKKRDERTFEITIVNTKSTKVNINVYDQVPIIPNKNYKVNIVDIAGAEHDKETGLLTWNIALEPGAKKIIKFSYSVDYPKYMNLDID